MAITRGKIATPSKDVIYGPEGVGKSSLGATYPNAVFGDCEGSTVKLDVAREIINTWNEFVIFTNLLIANDPDVVDFETVVFDTGDWLQKIAIRQILKEDGNQNMNENVYSYGKDSVRIGEFFSSMIIPIFDKILLTGRNVVILAHSEIKGFDDPILGRYDFYRINMDKRASAIIKEWANNIFFINYKTYINQGDGFAKNRAIGGSEVIIHTKKAAQYEAKRRDDLDDIITFEENENPYPHIIGTEVIKAEKLGEIEALKTEGEILKYWKTNFIFTKKTWFIDAVKVKGESLKK